MAKTTTRMPFYVINANNISILSTFSFKMADFADSDLEPRRDVPFLFLLPEEGYPGDCPPIRDDSFLSATKIHVRA